MFDGEIPFTPQVRSLLNEGMKYHVSGNLDAARMYYDAVLLLDPDNPIALQNLSGILFCANQNWAALSVAKRGLVAARGNPGVLANHAAALMHLGQFARAQREIEDVLSSVKDDGGLWHNYALILSAQGKLRPAITALETGLKLRQVQDMLADYGLMTLATGDIKLGCERYECRWKGLKNPATFSWGIPEWKGEELSGKRIVLAHEQGIGDGIMLARFAKDLKECGAEVTIATLPSLVRLLEHSNLGVPVRDINRPPEQEFDFHTPMLSAMGHLEHTTKSISPTPYISAEPRKNLGPDGFRVGICWASGDHSIQLQRRRRIVPLELLFCLAEIPSVRLVSLQKGPGEGDILSVGAESFILDQMGAVQDFYDTAEIVAGLDLVVSVDSAVVHLAGAMGKPTIMLGPYTRCWRWWGETHGLPWYNDFRIFAAEGLNDWTGAVKRTKQVIEYRVNEWKKTRIAA